MCGRLITDAGATEVAVDTSRALSLKLHWCCTLLTWTRCCVQRCKSWSCRDLLLLYCFSLYEGVLLALPVLQLPLLPQKDLVSKSFASSSSAGLPHSADCV
jgi:hypothetical protein